MARKTTSGGKAHRFGGDWTTAPLEVRQGDANEEIQDLCGKDCSSHRAVLFLDPYGMQVDWATIEAVARTKVIDLWLLFPLGIGVNRPLKGAR